MSTRAARTVAQAKLNLRLRVLARESGGHHQLETIFLRIALGDDVVVRAGVHGRSLDCRGADVGPLEQNLAWRAAMAMRDAGGPDTFAIEIDKRVPVGGGLGGGSADAGAVLRALNALTDRPLEDERLLAIAFTLGADVPFLTTELPAALAWGRGERLLAVAPPPEADVWLAVPPFSIATRDAYAWLAESRADRPYPAAPSMMRAERVASWATLAASSANDFEQVVEARHPRLELLRTCLADAGAALARLAGSGSTVFGIFPSGATDEELTARLRALRATPIHTRTVSSVAPVELG